MKKEHIINLTSLLSEAGWYPGRNIAAELIDLPLTKLLPTCVFTFFTEFGGLSPLIRMSGNQIYQKLDFSDVLIFFSSEKVLSIYTKSGFKAEEKVNISLGDQSRIYYYSVLTRTQLYAISDLNDGALMLMDCENNFYFIDGLGNLHWIGTSATDAFIAVLYGSKNLVTFNEESLNWNTSNELQVKLPVNNLLNGINPF